MVNEKVASIVAEIREKAFGPNGKCLQWDSIDYQVRNYNQTMQMTNTYRVGSEEGDYNPIKLFGTKGKELRRMKVAAYEKGRGSWISLRLTIFNDREPDIDLLFDEEIKFTNVLIDTPASAGPILSELAAFPRFRENIPDWMASMVEEAGESLIFLDPETDELVYGAERTPYKEPIL